MMSDSTNILSPGRTLNEHQVEQNLCRYVESHRDKGRVIVTQFASNLGRLGAVKRAAEASGRLLCLLGASFVNYMHCATLAGIQPFDIYDSSVIMGDEISGIPEEKLLIVTTGSQV